MKTQHPLVGKTLHATSSSYIVADDAPAAIRAQATAEWHRDPRLRSQFPKVEQYIAQRESAVKGGRNA